MRRRPLSWIFSGGSRGGLLTRGRTGAWLLIILILSSGHLLAESATNAHARAEQLYRQAHAQYEAQPNNPEAQRKLASACFDLAEVPENDVERAKVGEEGIAVARKLLATDPKSAQGHYYLGLNLGEIARTKSMGALKLVDEMEAEFTQAVQLDDKFDFGGADRALGLLYLDAPVWPVSVGSRSKARQHLMRAVELSPDYPENRLCLLEADLKWNNHAGIIEQSAKLKELWPEAHQKYSGEAFEMNWVDWQQRWDNIQKELQKPRTERAPKRR